MTLPLLEKLPEHRHHSNWADSRAHRVLEAFLIRFSLVLPAESREYRAAEDIDRGSGSLVVANAGENARQGYADVRALRFLHLLHRVPPHDVSDLVAEDAGELVHLVGALDEAAIHVHEAPRNRERVHFLRVDDEELPVEILTAREPGNRVAEHIDVAIDLWILDDR
jgi:hypothetical protein